VQIGHPQTTHIATDDFYAIEAPHPFGCGVEVAYLLMAIDDHHGFDGLLKCCEQEFGSLDRNVIAGRHRPTLGPGGSKLSSSLVETRQAAGKHIVAAVSKAFV
jgi:hypothetical protein